MEILKNVKIPDISFHGGHLNSNTFQVTESSKNVQISDDSALNGVKLDVNDLGAQFHSSSFEYKISFLKCKGSVNVSIKNMDVDLVLGLTKQTLPNGKVVPGVSVP